MAGDLRLSEVRGALLRRKRVWIAGLPTALALALVVAAAAPVEHRATARLLVAPLGASDKALRPPAVAETLGRLEARFRSGTGETLGEDSAAVRQALTIRPERTEGRAAPVSLAVEWRDPDPARARTMADSAAASLAALHDDDLRATAAQRGAGPIAEATRLEAELDRAERAVAAYRAANRAALPEAATARDDARAAIAAAAETRGRERLLLEATRGVLTAMVPPEHAALQAELAARASVLSEQHPTMRTLRRRLAALDPDDPEPGTAAELARVEAGLSALRAAGAGAAARERELDAATAAAPGVEAHLAALLRRRDRLADRHRNALVARDTNAGAEPGDFRLVPLEPARLRGWPVPPRLAVLLAVAGAGGVLALGLAVWLDIRGGRLRGAADFAERLGHAPLATVPVLAPRTTG